MIKRLGIVACCTGSSQILSVIAIGVVARYCAPHTIGSIGVVESYVLLIGAMISFGLQLATNRDIVLSQQWSQYFEMGQKARIAMAVMLLPVSLLYFLNEDFVYLLFLGSPLIALNGDYALYGRGMPEYASFLSFIRVAIPSLTLLICAFVQSEHILAGYIFSLFAGIYVAGYFTSKRLKVPYVFSLAITNIKYYWGSLGLVALRCL